MSSRARRSQMLAAHQQGAAGSATPANPIQQLISAGLASVMGEGGDSRTKRRSSRPGDDSDEWVSDLDNVSEKMQVKGYQTRVSNLNVQQLEKLLMDLPGLPWLNKVALEDIGLKLVHFVITQSKRKTGGCRDKALRGYKGNL